MFRRKIFSIANPLQFAMSAITIVIFAGFAYYMYRTVHRNKPGTILTNAYFARFTDIDGISVGSDVKISGYKVGSVTNIELVPQSYDIRLTINVVRSVPIPKDSSASVRTSGLIGNKFIALQPGAEEDFLEDNEEIIYTQSAINLETLIGKFINK